MAADAKSAAVAKLKAFKAAAAKAKADAAAKAAEEIKKARISPIIQKLATQIDIKPKRLQETSFASLRPYLTKLGLWSPNYVLDASSLLQTIQRKCRANPTCSLTTLDSPSYKKIWSTIASNQTRVDCKSAITDPAACTKASALKLRQLEFILAGVAGSRFQYLASTKSCKTPICHQTAQIAYNTTCQKSLCP